MGAADADETYKALGSAAESSPRAGDFVDPTGQRRDSQTVYQILMG